MKKARQILTLLLVMALALSLLGACAQTTSGASASPAASAKPSASAGPAATASGAATSAAPAASASAKPAESKAPVNADNAATKTVRVGIAGNPASLDPWSSFSEGRVDVLRNLYEFLFDISAIGKEIVPVIASGYKQVDDTTYSVTLYPNVKDSKGNAITADDVAFSYTTAIKLGFSGANLGSVDTVTAIDKLTVQIKFKSVAAGTFENAVGYTAIVSKAEYEKDPKAFISNPVGTGAYVVTKYVPGSSLTFSKNPNYWQTDSKLRAKFSQANIGTIQYVVIPEATQLTMALESGNVDVGYFVATSDLKRFEGNNKYAVLKAPKDLADVILFNGKEDNIFAKNVKLRQAVCYALDKKVLLKNAYDGVGQVCKTYGSAVFSDYLQKWEKEEYFEYNPEKSKLLLKDAGYANGVTVRLLVANKSEHIRMAQIMQSMLGAVGITVKIVQVDNTSFTSIARVDPSPAPWDICLDSRSSFDFIVNVWSFSFSAERNKGTTVNWFVDDKLQSLLKTATGLKTHNEANTDALHTHLKEICIGMGICNPTNNFVSVNTITSFTKDFKSRLLPGACTYTADFAGAK